MHKKTQSAAPRSKPALRVGFVPLTDCAPLVMGRELGLYEKYNLRVNLSRELGWATVRDKVIYGELDAAHALAALPVATTLGLGSPPCDCLTALVLNLNGNAITLSEDLWKRGVRDGRTLRDEIRCTRRDRTLTFGVVFPYSSHRQLLRRWFAAHGIDAARDVRIVVVPPPQMVANLKSGNLDGFCVGEPWNSVAVESRAGWIAATSAELDPGHPEKVLMVRREFATKRTDEHHALIAALLEACHFCDQPENHRHVAAVLARPEYVGVPDATLERGLSGHLDLGHAQQRLVETFCTFHRYETNEPGGDKAAWTFELVRESGLCPDPSAINFAIARQIFRHDIFEKALTLSASPETPTSFRSECPTATL